MSEEKIISLREKQSSARRRQMLDSAESLIRQCGSTDFSMRALATAAEVAPATPYNFFGTKEGLLFALLTRSLESFLDEALDTASTDPVMKVLDAADKAVQILLRDPVLLRPLYQVMLGLTDPIHHPQFLADAFVFYRRTLDAVVEKKLVPDEHERSILACAMMAHFMGVLDLWVHNDIDDDWFRAQIAYGFIHLLWPIAHGKSLTLLKERYTSVKKTLNEKQATQPALFGQSGRPNGESRYRPAK